jgi:hypothetical protein
MTANMLPARTTKPTYFMRTVALSDLADPDALPERYRVTAAKSRRPANTLA